jgi:hypothetical protein
MLKFEVTSNLRHRHDGNFIIPSWRILTNTEYGCTKTVVKGFDQRYTLTPIPTFTITGFNLNKIVIAG